MSIKGNKKRKKIKKRKKKETSHETCFLYIKCKFLLIWSFRVFISFVFVYTWLNLTYKIYLHSLFSLIYTQRYNVGVVYIPMDKEVYIGIGYKCIWKLMLLYNIYCSHGANIIDFSMCPHVFPCYLLPSCLFILLLVRFC